MRADPAATAPADHDKPESYADLWTREAPRAIAGSADRPAGRAVFDRLFANASAETWTHAIEIGGGDARYTAEVLAANLTVKLAGFDVSEAVMQAASAKLATHVAAGRLEYHRIDPVHPDSILKVVERARLKRQVDAVFSIDSLVHVDLQYQLAYWINAALVLKPGGWLIMSVADATSAAGFAKLTGDIRTFFAFQGQACPRFEYQSLTMVTSLLQNIGFEVPYIWNWNPVSGGQRWPRPLCHGAARPPRAGRSAAWTLEHWLADP